MNESVVVFGPKGCGKTRHAEAIRKKLGLATVLDEGKMMNGVLPRIPPNGALVLCVNVPVGWKGRAIPFYSLEPL